MCAQGEPDGRPSSRPTALDFHRYISHVSADQGRWNEPRVLLLDEPTAHLDPVTVAVVESVLMGENRSRGMAVVWATRNLFQARRVAHRTGLLLNGELVEVAPTRPAQDPGQASILDAFREIAPSGLPSSRGPTTRGLTRRRNPCGRRARPVPTAIGT